MLDVGCGYGALAASMSDAGAIVYGIDLNGKSIEQAKSRYHNPCLTFLHGDISTVTLPGEFDTVVMSNVLEHIENRKELLGRLQEMVSPKRFLIRVPMIDRDWMVSFRKELGLPHFSDPTHFIEYTVETFADEMAGAGFEVISHEVKWGELYAEVYPREK